MAKLIDLIDFDEIKTLRITCEKCHAYWSVPIPFGDNNLLTKCVYCNNVISMNRLVYIERMLQEIENIQKYLEDFKISIELEKEEIAQE